MKAGNIKSHSYTGNKAEVLRLKKKLQMHIHQLNDTLYFKFILNQKLGIENTLKIVWGKSTTLLETWQGKITHQKNFSKHFAGWPSGHKAILLAKIRDCKERLVFTVNCMSQCALKCLIRKMKMNEMEKLFFAGWKTSLLKRINNFIARMKNPFAC